MKIGYIRVSRDKQTTALQEDAMRQEQCDRVFTDKMSGKPFEGIWGIKIADLDFLNHLFYDTELSKNYDTQFCNLHQWTDETDVRQVGSPDKVWEGSYILDMFAKEDASIRPETVHGDTQAQSTTVFGLAHLLGISLMPRIRNWKDLKLFRPDPNVHYTHLESLFSEPIEWRLIETHLPDMIRVALSIKAGKITPSTIFRKRRCHHPQSTSGTTQVYQVQSSDCQLPHLLQRAGDQRRLTPTHPGRHRVR